MKRVSRIKRAAEWNGCEAVDRVVLDAGDRQRRRIVLTGEEGTTFLLDLPQATALRDGDGLVLDDGAIVRVVGLSEPLIELSAASALGFVRLAWHLGNRHTDAQFAGAAIRIRRDHVLEDMARQLGARMRPIDAPFDPEAGALRHLSPSGRGRPEGPGEGGPTFFDDSEPPHPNPLPASGERERAEVAAGALYRLMAWLSPSYPIGAFSYSGGLEWAVEAGDVTDAATLQHWLAVVIGQGGGFCDAVFFTHAHRAAAGRDAAALRAVAELASAFAPSKERHLETTAQGHAFVEATRAAWPCAALERLLAVWDGPVAYPVAVGAAAAGHGIALEQALRAFVQAITANLISAGLRLVPLGQTDGQRVLAALEPLVAATAQRALATTTLEEVGGASFRADLSSMRHETQYTRLFRS